MVFSKRRRPRFPTFSPDGRWIACFSDDAGGGLDVYVSPFPGPGGKWRRAGKRRRRRLELRARLHEPSQDGSGLAAAAGAFAFRRRRGPTRHQSLAIGNQPGRAAAGVRQWRPRPLSLRSGQFRIRREPGLGPARTGGTTVLVRGDLRLQPCADAVARPAVQPSDARAT